jgi:hypothetical protein
MSKEEIPKKEPAEVVEIRPGVMEEKSPAGKRPSAAMENLNLETKTYDRSNFDFAIFNLLRTEGATLEPTKPMQITEEGNNAIKIILGVSVKLQGVPLKAKGDVAITMQNYLNSHIRVSRPQITAGFLDRLQLEKVFNEANLFSLPQKIQKQLVENDEEVKGKIIQKMLIKDGKIQIIFKDKGPITTVEDNSAGRITRVSLDPELLETVEDEDYAEANRIEARRANKNTKEENLAQAEKNRKTELLEIPYVKELIKKAEGMIKIPIKAEAGQKILDILSSGEGYAEFFKNRIARTKNPEEQDALQEVERIEKKYDIIFTSLRK